MTTFSIQADYAQALDKQDALARFRDEFVIDDPNLIYLDGNSLGRLPKRSSARLRDAVDREWGARLIRGWNEGWYTAPTRIGSKVAQLVGAGAEEVVVADSTSVNLFKLVVAALTASPNRHTVITDDLNFPSDLYIMQGAIKLSGADHRLNVLHSRDGQTVSLDDLRDAIDDDTALVALSHTAFKSGYVYDMRAVTGLAHRAGALMLWDVCHSVGAMPIHLNDVGADLAVGCTYKYLNGGPGAPAFLYVRRDLQQTLMSPIWGWFGQHNPFDFDLDYQPASDIHRFLAGTPPMLSLSAVETGVDLLLEAGLDRVRAKSIQQTDYLIQLWESVLKPLGFTLNSPRDSNQRGSHVSIGHAEALQIDHALIQEMNLIPDFRAPDNIRLGIAPLYTSFADIHEGVMRIARVVTEGIYKKYARQSGEVT